MTAVRAEIEIARRRVMALVGDCMTQAFTSDLQVT